MEAMNDSVDELTRYARSEGAEEGGDMEDRRASRTCLMSLEWASIRDVTSPSFFCNLLSLLLDFLSIS